MKEKENIPCYTLPKKKSYKQQVILKDNVRSNI